MTAQKFNDVEPLTVGDAFGGATVRVQEARAGMQLSLSWAHDGMLLLSVQDAEALYAWLGKALGKV